jgi:hypothetical protein
VELSVQKQILEAVISIIDTLGLYPTLDIGPLPAANGLSIATASGGVEESTLVHGGQYDMVLALNGKHTGQVMVYDALCTIHEALEKLSVYPAGTNWAVTGIRSVGSPTYLDHENDGWLYGSSIRIDYVID